MLGLLAQFARAQGAPVTVVFDGPPEADVPDGTSYDGVHVRYAPRGSSADEVIKTMVAQSHDPGALTVVTSDKDLIQGVRALGAQTIRSGEFRRLLGR